MVVEVDDEAVTVYDPLHDEGRLSRQSFATGWAAQPRDPRRAPSTEVEKTVVAPLR
jgi:hypothetical protein